MSCPVPHHKDTPTPPGHPSVAAAQASDEKNGDVTPGFEPNAPASVIPSDQLTLEGLLYESGAGDGNKPASVDEWPLPEELDFTRPVSELLRKGTQRAHVAAEHSEGAVALTNGQLELQEYIRWLALLWRVYDALEQGLAAHASNAVLAPTYDPTLLARAPELAADIKFLLKRLPKDLTKESKNPLASNPSVPLPPFPLPPFLEEVFVITPPALRVYMDRVNELAASEATAPRLLAHAYVRYLGDLSGGQIIGARLRKAYNLPGLDGRRFYYFDVAITGDDKAAVVAGEETVGERKKKLNDVKVWYRTGMDEGAGDDEKLKAALVREANVAFVLNTHLFSLITPPPAPGKELRYFEKRQREEARRLALHPHKPLTWTEFALKFMRFIFACLFGVFVTHAMIPTLWPKIAPWFHGTVVPVLNDKVIPWWDENGPIVNRHLKRATRQMF